MSKDKKVNLTRATKPKFLTLTGRPANQVAFKILRNDNGEEVMTPHIQRQRRTRRSDSPVLRIAFPEGVTADEARSTLDGYGLSGYEVSETDEGVVAVRSDAPEATDTLQVVMAGGEVATILKPVAQRADEGPAAIAVVSMEFAADYFETSGEVTDWLKRNDVDFQSDALENGDQGTVVRRTETQPDDVRRVEVDPGVVFVIARADEESIPVGYEAVITDTAYGNWGWGHLDFAAAMADKEFCRLAEESTYVLRNVCDRILFYSELPLAQRKVLIAEAAGQYASFVGSLMDALPTRAVKAVHRTDSQKGNAMSKQDQKKDDVKREDPATVAEGTAAAAADESAAADGISRADVESMIGSAIGGLTAKIDELATALRADPAKAEDAPQEEAKPVTLEDVMRSVSALADGVKNIETRVGEMEGATVSRADGGDPAQEQVERSDVFAGVFSNKKPA